MTISFTRRNALLMALFTSSFFSAAEAFSAETDRSIEEDIRLIETKSGGELGVAVLDTGTNQVVGHRLDERFALCSTFKALAIAFVLARVDQGKEQLDRRVDFSEQDLVLPYKATKPHVGPEGMTIDELCKAAAIYSDSTAANLLLASFGGPAELTDYLRSIGDNVTRVDNVEPKLNIVKPGELHDTTSPRAMAETMKRIILGDMLSPRSRGLLTDWLVNGQDAATQRLRKGVPAGWRIANKPGTWKGISTNDVGVIWPPHRPPVVVAAYLSHAPGSIESQEAVLADVARCVCDRLLRS